MADSNASWLVPAVHPPLGESEVHVWWAQLDGDPATLEELRRTLDEEEQRRAARFVQPIHRDRFAAARGWLRVLLARYLQCAPQSVRFTYNAHGKPSLTPETGGGLYFNVSHSHDAALLAFSRAGELGVDLERIRPDFGTLEIAKRFFARREFEQLSALPSEHQTQAFFDCWTRKEAYIKARGDGLTRALGSFEVSLGPGEPPALLHADDDPNAATRWRWHPLLVIPGYALALVTSARAVQLRCWSHANRK